MEQRKLSSHQQFVYRTAALTLVAAITSYTAMAQNSPTPIPPYSVCSQNVNSLSLLPPPPNSGSPPNPNEDGDTQYLNALIGSTEAMLIRETLSTASLGLANQMALL